MVEYLAKPAVFRIVLVGTNAAVGYKRRHSSRPAVILLITGRGSPHSSLVRIRNLWLSSF